MDHLSKVCLLKIQTLVKAVQILHNLFLQFLITDLRSLMFYLEFDEYDQLRLLTAYRLLHVRIVHAGINFEAYESSPELNQVDYSTISTRKIPIINTRNTKNS